MAKDGRTRAWSFIVYPESAPNNWRDIIDDYHIEWVESPLHDKDIIATGEIKKAHYHILVVFLQVKSYEQVKEISDSVNAPIPQKCHNVKSLVRYMAHLDNPDKAQYSVSDIIAHGGIDVAELLKPSSAERYTIIKDMIKFVQEHNITEYQDLVDYAMYNQFDDWFPLLCDSCTYVVNQYIKSARHRAAQEF